MIGTEIDKIHHVGHVVQDMEAALELYRKLGFVCTPPRYPMMESLMQVWSGIDFI